MAKKKLAKIQDIPDMKIFDGPNGPEMYTTDPKFSGGSGWLTLMAEAKMQCRKVKIKYLETPESEPKTLVVAPVKLMQSVAGWEFEDLSVAGQLLGRYSLQKIVEAEMTDDKFEEPDILTLMGV